MKLNFTKDLFDEYDWKARVLPSLITLAPLIISSVIIGWFSTLAVLFSLAASLGLVFFFAQISRTLGKRSELKLIQLWDGFPTTQALRFATKQNKTIFKSRRLNVEAALNIHLPTNQSEKRHPERADDEYESATRSLISKVRMKRQEFPRVHEENINYGFRRNLYGLKPVGLAINIIIVLASIIVYITGGWHVQAAGVGILGILFGSSWLIVTPKWVRETADSYSNRLFETLEEGL